MIMQYHFGYFTIHRVDLWQEPGGGDHGLREDKTAPRKAGLYTDGARQNSWGHALVRERLGDGDLGPVHAVARAALADI